MNDMMSLMNTAGGNQNLAILAFIFFLVFWAGVFLLAVYVVSTAKDDKYKVYLVAGLSLVIGILFIGSLLSGAMMKSIFGKEIMKSNFKTMMQDADIKTMINNSVQGSNTNSSNLDGVENTLNQ